MIVRISDNLITEENDIVEDFTKYWSDIIQANCSNDHCLYFYVGF